MIGCNRTDRYDASDDEEDYYGTEIDLTGK